jgi:hypothetical protein
MIFIGKLISFTVLKQSELLNWFHFDTSNLLITHFGNQTKQGNMANKQWKAHSFKWQWASTIFSSWQPTNICGKRVHCAEL